MLAERKPVLAQIQLPHNYYYREMYLPQLTSGPSALTFSPDGKEVVFSMSGSLWRQTIGSDQASELTHAGGYDYLPDWSHDGRHIVLTRYQNDTLELWQLDLQTGKEVRSPRMATSMLNRAIRRMIARSPSFPQR